MLSSRVEQEKNYWNKAANDPDVDIKYISDLPTDECLKAIGDLDGKVLEIGCGVGRLMKPGYYGIDISGTMILIAERRKPNCYFSMNDGRTIPEKKETFDNVYCVLVFQHIPLEGVEAYIKETARVLKLGGKFTFQFIEGGEKEPFSHHHDIKDILKILNKNGLEEIKISVGGVHEQWTWITARKL